jgi:excisionase family DNA binding protein
MIRGRGRVARPVQASGTVRAWESLADDPLLTTAEIAEQFNIDQSTARRWIARRKLLATRIGGQLRVRTSEILRFANIGEE